MREHLLRGDNVFIASRSEIAVREAVSELQVWHIHVAIRCSLHLYVLLQTCHYQLRGPTYVHDASSALDDFRDGAVVPFE